MTPIIVYAAVAVAAWFWLTATTWERYLAVMALKRARDRGGLTLMSKVFGYPVAARGVVTDALYNIVVGTLMFAPLGNPARALPREWLFTTRLERHIREGGLRGRVALAFCRRLLNDFDPDGKHCG